MQILENFSLADFNSFGINARAAFLIKVRSKKMLRAAIAQQKKPLMILGGGSNILLTRDVSGLVLKNEIKGKKIVATGENTALVAVGGGENWHRFVLWTLKNNLGGVENLSLIPGTVGAAPIQNIGAYGVELKDVFEKLEAVDLKTGETQIFDKNDCRFGYRESIFKTTLKGRFFITKVFFRLTTTRHFLHTGYGDIQSTLDQTGIKNPTIHDVSKAVIAIRTSKLPDPAKLGNAGSFFKNPEISAGLFEKLQAENPAMPSYPQPNNLVKIPAGWLIEQCGWKGKRVGNAGSHARQALVVGNYGGAPGEEIGQLAQSIRRSVFEKFGIELTPEVNVI